MANLKKFNFTFPLLAAGLFLVLIFSSCQAALRVSAAAQISKTAQHKSIKPAALYNAADIKIPILMYHHVGDLPAQADKTRVDLTVPTANFLSQVNWLKQNGYHSISLSDLLAYMNGGFQLPAKPVIFTFDDGYSDVFANAIPILKQAGFGGSFGIITNFPGTSANGNNYASWQQIVDAKNQGMEIVCHTQNHFDGLSPKFSADYIYNNLSGCQNALTGHLGASLPILIYPYGHYNATYLEQAKKVGIEMGITVSEAEATKADNLMELPRVRVHGKEILAKFIKALTQPATAQMTLAKTSTKP